MKNTTIKTLLFIPLFIGFLIVCISAHKSLWPSNNVIDNDTKATCVQFQLLKGSNRIAEFAKIEQVAFNKVAIAKNINIYDVEKILGKPDIVQSNNWQYYVDANMQSKVVLNIQQQSIINIIKINN